MIESKRKELRIKEKLSKEREAEDAAAAGRGGGSAEGQSENCKSLQSEAKTAEQMNSAGDKKND